MGEIKKFAPTVLIDGVTYTPEGWMWILSYALAGIPWAVELALDPEFNLREKIDDYNRRKKVYFLQVEAEMLERGLKAIAKELKLIN